MINFRRGQFNPDELNRKIKLEEFRTQINITVENLEEAHELVVKLRSFLMNIGKKHFGENKDDIFDAVGKIYNKLIEALKSWDNIKRNSFYIIATKEDKKRESIESAESELRNIYDELKGFIKSQNVQSTTIESIRDGLMEMKLRNILATLRALNQNL